MAHSAASVPVDVRADVPPAKLADEAKVAALQRLNCRFCKRCGSPMQLAVPPGEDDLRHVCGNCSFVDYHNPKMVVGCVIEHEGKVLLCKRALEPCAGLWTLPAGYMELGETCAGARDLPSNRGDSQASSAPASGVLHAECALAADVRGCAPPGACCRERLRLVALAQSRGPEQHA